MFQRMKLLASIIGTVGLLVAVTRTSHAQMTKANIESLTVRPPAHPFNHTTGPIPLVGGITLFTVKDYAVNLANQNVDDPENVAYVKVQGTLGTTVKMSAHFGVPVPPVTSSGGDACFHAHLETAVYALHQIQTGFSTTTRVLFVGSSGEYGRRMLNGVEVEFHTPGATCVVSSDPETFFPTISKSFIWGSSSSYVLNFPLNPFDKITEYYIAAQATQHTWGDCGLFVCHPEILFFGSRTQ